MCRKKRQERYECVFAWFINSFARDTCVSEMPADIKGQKKMLRMGGGEKETERRRVTVGGERSDIQCDLFVVMKSLPYTIVFFHLCFPTEFGV